MLKKIFALTGIVLIGTLIKFSLPLVPNPDPDYQTELAHQNYDTTQVQAVLGAEILGTWIFFHY